MRNLVSEYIIQFRQDRQKQLKLVAVLAALAVIVAGVVFWQLHSTGVAMTNEVFCGQEEHVHSDACYDGDTLACVIPEHTHTIACLSDDTADVETAKVWETTLPAELTGVWADDVVAIAESQLGYTESSANFVLSGDGGTRQGYTRYGAWYGNEYGDWDAMFASFCLHYAGVPEEDLPEASGAYAWITQLEDLNDSEDLQIYRDAAGYTPCPGDLVFLDTDENGQADRVGIVKELTVPGEDGRNIAETLKSSIATGFIAIEGDCDNSVQETEYQLDDVSVIGYGVLPEQNADTGYTDSVIYTARDNGVEVEVVLPDGAVPEDAVLSVSLFDEDSSEYAEAAALMESMNAGSNGAENDDGHISVNLSTGEEPEPSIAALDISFLLDGVEVEPTEPASVIIDVSQLLCDCEGGVESLEIWHLEEAADGAEPVLVAEITDAEEAAGGVAEFTIESFSQFDVRWYPGSSTGNYYGQIHVNLIDADSGDGITVDYSTFNYFLGENESMVLSEGSAFISAIGLDDYTFSYATVEDGSTGVTYGSEDDSVAYVVMSYAEGSSYTWTYTFYDSDGNELYSYTETGRSSSAEPVLNLYFKVKQENFLITWTAGDGTGRWSFLYYEIRDASNEKVMSAGKDVQKNGWNSPIIVDEQNFLKNVSLDGYVYAYATVTDPATGKTYGSKDQPVTQIAVKNITDDSVWTYVIYSNEEVLLTVDKQGTTGSTSAPDPERDLMLSLYYEKTACHVRWNSGNNWQKRTYIYYEVRDAGTGELIPEANVKDIDRSGYNSPLNLTSSGFLGNFDLSGDYAYLYSEVYDPVSGETYGGQGESVTQIAADLETKDSDAATNLWTFSIYSDDTLLAELDPKQGTSSTVDEPDPDRDLKLTVYYIKDDSDVDASYVVLNGTDGSASDGDRSYITGLEEYADAVTGEIKIELPGNEELGSAFAVYTAEDGTEITVNSARGDTGDSFSWKLAGWLNLATGEYVDVSNGPAETTIYLDQDYYNVFKADWVASTYDHGDSASGVNTVETESTADFVTIRLFDYNELFNTYSTGLAKQTSIAGETFSDSNYLYDSPVLLNGSDEWKEEHLYNSDVSSFIFQNTGMKSGSLTYPSSLRNWNVWSGTGGVMRDANENWNITNPILTLEQNPLLTMLFNPDYSYNHETGEGTLGVTYVGTADHLFQYGTNEDEGQSDNKQQYVGYYYYSSNLNAAEYDQASGNFNVYEEAQLWRAGNPNTMFLPFNTYTTETLSNSQVDYWFGMSMQVDFYLPGAAGEKETDEFGNEVYKNVHLNPETGEYDDMVFNFSGDDDILIFVDDTLVLDMSGIHDEADGSINFATGAWECYINTNTSENHGNTLKSGSLEGSLEAGSHTLTVYYMERGAGASNLTISFNIVPVWVYESDSVTTVSVDKEWADGSEAHENDSVLMGLFEQVDYTDKTTDGEGLVTSVTVKEETDGETVSHVYIYNAVASEGAGYSNVYYFEDDGGGIGWYDTEYDVFYILTDPPLDQENPVKLNAENDWSYTWEQLYDGNTYIVLEMAMPEGYTAVRTVEDNSGSTDYTYWSIIGETELEDSFVEAGTTMQIILTDAAQSGTVDNPVGYVVHHDAHTKNKEIEFSMIPTVISDEEGTKTMYGVVSDSQITEDMVWILTYTTDTGGELYGSDKLHTFTLSYTDDSGTAYYLAVTDGVLTTTVSADDAAEFYCDVAGELRILADEELRLTIDSYGNLAVKHTEDTLQDDNVRIYTLTTGHTEMFAYHYLNKSTVELPSAGGIGTGIYIVAGLVLVSGAALLLIRKRRAVTGS